MAKLLFILFQAALINNFILVRFLGVTSMLGQTFQMEVAIGMGFAVTLVMVLASLITWFINSLILIPLGVSFLQLVFFMITIVVLVQVLALYLGQKSPKLHQQMGVYMPLLLTNCAILGVTVLNVQNQLTLIESLFFSVGGGLGFLMVLVVMTSLRDRLEGADVPQSFRGAPIMLVAAAILSLALTVFSSFSVH